MAKIVKAIVHELPKGTYEANAPSQVRYSDFETNLAAKTRRFIEENMLDFALQNPRQVIQDPDASSTTPRVVTELLTNSEADFVALSKELALNLHQAQTSGSNSGIFIMALVTTTGGQALALLKAEHQEGMQLRQVVEDGSVHFDLEHLDELIIGNNSRVFKVALLHITPDGIAGQMVDNQNGAAFARFFLQRFLGCSLFEQAELQTRHFFDAAMAFANDRQFGASERARYSAAVVAYVQAPSDTFSAEEFAETYLEPEHRDGFYDRVPADVGKSVVTKDTTLLAGHGSGLRYYADGVVISASAEALESGLVEVLSEDDGGTVIRIRGTFRRIALGSAPAARPRE